MGERSNRHLFLRTLLDMDALDIRRLSRDDHSLQAGEYFKTLSKFINRINMILEAMQKIADHKAAEYDFRHFNEFRDLLDGIGGDKYLPVFDDIIGAGKRGHSKFASDCAKNILIDFTSFCTQLKEAQEEAARTDAPDADDLTDENYKKLLLKDIFQQMDQEKTGRKMKILAVDDSHVMLKTITTALCNDYDVYGMANPLMVEKFLQKVTPDLFLLDYKMPGLNGFELVPIIRNFAEHKNTPIIFLTSIGTPDYVSAALALGASDYIVKPFVDENLRAKIAKQITKKRQ